MSRTPISFDRPLEIGILYQGDKGYYLAIDANRLVTYRRHKFVVKTRRPGDIFYLTHKFSVDDLCKMWKISIEQLDEMSARFLPPVLPLRPAPKGQVRNGRINRIQTLAVYEEIRRNKKQGSEMSQMARMLA